MSADDDWGPHDSPHDTEDIVWVIGSHLYMRGHKITITCPDCGNAVRDTRGEDTLAYVCACTHQPAQAGDDPESHLTAQTLVLEVGPYLEEWDAYGNGDREARIHQADEKAIIRCPFGDQTHRWLVRSPTLFSDTATDDTA